MKVTPSSTARRSTAWAAARSRVGSKAWGPHSRSAPNPIRIFGMSMPTSLRPEPVAAERFSLY
jgi:hypothetical protein